MLAVRGPGQPLDAGREGAAFVGLPGAAVVAWYVDIVGIALEDFTLR